MNFLKYGLPWVCYGIGLGTNHPAWGSLAAFLLVAGAIAAAPRRTKSVEVVLGIFFLLSACRISWLVPWQASLAPALLALLAFGSLAVGRPFTTAFAREVAPPEVWDDPRFLFVNRFLTVFWGTAFLFCAWLRHWRGLPPAATLALSCLVMFLAALFTKGFPEWYRRRSEATAPSSRR